MNTNDYIIRFEEKEDYREVENLVRESFWNVYRPGCSEHYVIHVLRDDPAFVKELREPEYPARYTVSRAKHSKEVKRHEIQQNHHAEGWQRMRPPKRCRAGRTGHAGYLLSDPRADGLSAHLPR